MSSSMVSKHTSDNVIPSSNISAESYLRTRKEATFDRYDFDSLSNKFVSKLVIRAN
jgi:hypothetical protein